MRKTRNARKMFVGKHENKLHKALERRLKDNIKIGL
jgi:hypothetical protein